MTPIADMVTRLIAAGTPPELAAAVVAEAFAAGVTQNVTRNAQSMSPGAIRSRRFRENHNENRQLAEANDAAKQPVTKRSAKRSAKRGVVTSSSLSLLEVPLESKKEVVARARGTRLSPDWQPSDEDRKFAADFAVDADWLRGEFVDYWIGIPGQRGTKTNWSATWRNRVRAIATKNGKTQGQPPVTGLMDEAEKDRLWAILRAPLNERSN